MDACPVHAIKTSGKRLETDRNSCTSCGRCVETCYAGAREIMGKYFTLDNLLRIVEEDKAFYDKSGGGVTVSGGDPLMQAQFIREFLRECRDRRIHTAIETSGYAQWKTMERVLEFTDLVLYDIKHMSSRRHRELTGVSNKLILQNLKKTADRKVPIIIRIPLVPDSNDSEENIENTTKLVAQLKNVQEIHILPYHRLGMTKYQGLDREYKLPNLSPPDAGKIQKCVKVMEKGSGLEVKVGG